MNFGDRILYNDNNNNVSKGVFIKELNQVEVLIKLDDKSEKSIVSKHYIKFVNNMDNMDLTHAIAVADYISKEKYDGHFTLLCFTTGCKFCFGTLDKINYNTTSLMASGKTIEDAIKIAIDKKIDSDKILDTEDKMYK
ncbi:hypothetical protein QX51_14235 [Terrisporobacter othiniensis]|uniref:Uncharacterized protein n=1 Tax=Terrisporobacter othiniensis TaxID=1577792 RepID=A0A0B3VUS2_9FIRM|nr:hypothetical protein [Terrisporobacter othiniensis]KHS56354.1 hypothetical protein QX51_14235 [Terrisporobacter othiniensis]